MSRMIEVIRVLGDLKEPASASDIVRRLNLPHCLTPALWCPLEGRSPAMEQGVCRTSVQRVRRVLDHLVRAMLVRKVRDVETGRDVYQLRSKA